MKRLARPDAEASPTAVAGGPHESGRETGPALRWDEGRERPTTTPSDDGPPPQWRDFVFLRRIPASYLAAREKISNHALRPLLYLRWLDQLRQKNKESRWIRVNVRAMAAETGRCKSSFARALNTLAKAGLIKRRGGGAPVADDRKASGWSSAPVEYRLNDGALKALPPADEFLDEQFIAQIPLPLIAAPREVLGDAEFRALLVHWGWVARCSGRPHMLAYSRIAREGGMPPRTARWACTQLIEKGFLRMLSEGRGRRASTWMLRQPPSPIATLRRRDGRDYLRKNAAESAGANGTHGAVVLDFELAVDLHPRPEYVGLSRDGGPPRWFPAGATVCRPVADEAEHEFAAVAWDGAGTIVADGEITISAARGEVVVATIRIAR